MMVCFPCEACRAGCMPWQPPVTPDRIVHAPYSVYIQQRTAAGMQDLGWGRVCSACRHNMEPNITLIWFVHPQWFQKMGAFSRRENLPVFVEWCETAFKLFGEASALGHT